MAAIDTSKVKMPELKTHVAALNATGFLDAPISIRVGVKKDDLAAAFVKGIEECHSKKKLDDVPDAIYQYYCTIVPPSGAGAANEDAGAAGDEGGTQTAPAAPKGRGKKAQAPTAPPKERAPKAPKAPKQPKAPKPPKEPRVTRSKVFADLLVGTKRKLATKEELADALNQQYSGRAKGEAEAKFWTTAFLRFAGDLGLLEAREDGKIKYIGQ
jgi:hypothetical protein